MSGGFGEEVDECFGQNRSPAGSGRAGRSMSERFILDRQNRRERKDTLNTVCLSLNNVWSARGFYQCLLIPFEHGRSQNGARVHWLFETICSKLCRASSPNFPNCALMSLMRDIGMCRTCAERLRILPEDRGFFYDLAHRTGPPSSAPARRPARERISTCPRPVARTPRRASRLVVPLGESLEFLLAPRLRSPSVRPGR